MNTHHPEQTNRMALLARLQVLASAILVLLLAGCAAPIGADKVTTRQSYAQVEENALRTGKPTITQPLDLSGSHE